MAVKTYLEVNPSSNVVLLEAASSVGGVWAKHRLYRGLKSNNMLGTYEYSDFPMDEVTFGVKPGEHIPGEVLHSYFERYVEKFGLADKIRLSSKVEIAEHTPDGKWRLTVTQSHGNRAETISVETTKLIVATGLTSEAFLPAFDGQDVFGASLFHSRDLPRWEKNVLQAGKRVSIFGGTKSAWDAAYTCAVLGIEVNWIIRESGHGPVWMAPPYVTPLKKWLEKLVTTRFLTWFSPCIWGNADGFGRIRSFLHGTWLGRKMVDTFWNTLANDVRQANGYDQHPEMKKLKPWVSPFWIASSLSILNYPTDFFELVKKGTIKIHIADISHLSAHAVHLSNGERIPTDTLICSTGWKATPHIKFLPPGIEQELGLPWSPDSMPNALIQQADEEILRRFPRLQNQPIQNPKYKLLSETSDAAVPHAIRLSRFMIPPSMSQERSIAFLGMTMSINTALIAQIQALWVVAYFNNDLSIVPTVRYPSNSVNDADRNHHPTESALDLEWETALHTQFGKWRYSAGFGKRNPDFVFDALPYMDLLLKDLGLRTHRKPSLLAECFDPYGPADYRGLVVEWKAKQDEVNKKRN